MVVPGLTPEEEHALSQRIGTAWKELRRGAAMATLRDHLFGAGDNALEPGQFDTLELLVQRRAWRMSELADALRVDPSTATRAVQRLLRTGLAERHPYREDGRVVMVSASPDGRRRYEAIARCRWTFMDRVMTTFSAEERRDMASLLERLVAAADEVAGISGRTPT